MSGEELEEETYSLIFKSLKHPIRRRILRILADEPLAFSKILNGLSIDSAHMTYHLEQLGELIIHTPDGKYRLSSIGTAAKKLMSRVEDQTPSLTPPTKKGTVFKTVTAVCIMLLVFALIPASLYFYQYVVFTNGWAAISHVLIPANQSFSYNITIVYVESGPTAYRSEEHSVYIKKLRPLETPTAWEDDYAIFDLEINSPSFFDVRTYDSDGKMVEHATVDYQVRMNTTRRMKIKINSPGTYRFESNNTRSKQTPCATLSAGMRREGFEKPYYYYGIAGLGIAIICPSFMLVFRILTKRKI
ncbi:MAG: winged helix-turn-helix domain-containing protein [Candidatus Bathyarchaeota archaeon]|nr:winged helix-turn-helix domain-containing protein [Candidatus Bathyarchaeota archaeon]